MKNFRAMMCLMTAGSILLTSCSTYQKGMRTVASTDEVFKTFERKIEINKIHPLAPKADPYVTIFEGMSEVPVQVEVSDTDDLDCKLIGTSDAGETVVPSDLKDGNFYFNTDSNQKVRCRVKDDSKQSSIQAEVKYHVVRQVLPNDDKDQLALNDELNRLKGKISDKTQLNTTDAASILKNGIISDDQKTWTIDPNIGTKDLGVISENSVIIVSSVKGEVEFPRGLNIFKSNLTTGPEGIVTDLNSKEKEALPFASERPYSVLCSFQKIEADQELTFKGASPSPTVMEGPGAARCVFNVPKAQGLKGFFEVTGFNVKRDHLISQIDTALKNVKHLQDVKEDKFNLEKISSFEVILDKTLKDSAEKVAADKKTYDFWASKEKEVDDYRKEAQHKLESAKEEAQKQIDLAKAESDRQLELAKADADLKLYMEKASRYFDDKVAAGDSPVAFEYTLDVVPQGAIKPVGAIKIHSQNELYLATNSDGKNIILRNPAAKLGDESTALDGQTSGSIILTHRPWTSAYKSLPSKKMLVCSDIAQKLSAVASSLKDKTPKDIGEVINEKAKSQKFTGLSFKAQPAGYKAKDAASCGKKVGSLELSRAEKYKFCFVVEKGQLIPKSIASSYQADGHVLWQEIGSESKHPFFKLKGLNAGVDGDSNNLLCADADNLFPDSDKLASQIKH